MVGLGLGGILVVFIVILILGNAVRILLEYERGVVFRLGRLVGAKGPGIVLLIPLVDRMKRRVSLRTQVLDVPPQDVITRDNVSVKVNAVVYYRVMDASRAVVEVENFDYATSQLSQTTLRSVLGQVELDELLAAREKINEHLQTILDKQTDPWGIKVSLVEIKHVDLPEEMKRVISSQAVAERERRAKVIHAEGELQASAKLQEAAAILGRTPQALHLRYLQTLTEISTEGTKVVVFPLPMEMLASFPRLAPKELPREP